MAYEYEYARPALSVDIVVRRTINDVPHILLIERLRDPHANCWALPGGFMEIDETLEQAAMRELEEETGLTSDSIPHQIAAFSTVDRDPRGRVISIAFEVTVAEDATAVAADDAKSLRWFRVDALPDLAFDHAEMLVRAGVTE